MLILFVFWVGFFFPVCLFVVVFGVYVILLVGWLVFILKFILLFFIIIVWVFCVIFVSVLGFF